MDPASTDAWPLTCPLCEQGLWGAAGTLACSSGHSFDVAKEGYVNLLPPQHRVRGVDGDVPSMLHARRRFLEAGYYEPLREALNVEISAALGARGPQAPDLPRGLWAAETGCGEGYFIGGIAEGLSGSAQARHGFLGCDLSKPAVKLAARRYTSVRFFVADVHRRIYLQDGALGVLLDVFAPRNPAEFARVLAPGGHAVVVIPDAAHLESVRVRLGLLDIQEDKEKRVLEQFAVDFRVEERRHLHYGLELPEDAVRDLIEMGPSRWHQVGGPPGTGGQTMSTEASFVILVFRRS